MKTINSIVKGCEGLCTPTWLNNNQVLNRLDNGVTGFFKRVKVVSVAGFKTHFAMGEEFHGIIKCGEVRSTKNEF